MPQWPPKPNHDDTKDSVADARAWANGSTWDAARTQRDAELFASYPGILRAPGKPLLWKCEYRIMPTKMAYLDPHQQSLTKKVKP